MNTSLISDHFPNSLVQIVDQLYNQAYKVFKARVMISLFLAFAKFTTVLSVIIYMYSQSKDPFTLFVIMPVIFFQLISYCLMKRISSKKNVFLNVALQLKYSRSFHYNQLSNDEAQSYVHDNVVNFKNQNMRQVSKLHILLLAFSIKFQMAFTKTYLMYMVSFLVFLQTSLILVGIGLIQQWIISQQIQSTDKLVILIILTIFLQNFQTFIFLALSPILLIILIIIKISSAINRYRQRRIFQPINQYRQRRRISASPILNRQLKKSKLSQRMQKFKRKQFQPNSACNICFSQILQNQNVCELDCNKLHYFHQTCIKKWFFTSFSLKCPLCKALNL